MSEPCQTCADNGRAGSCARLRCYCGHEDCWAFASWAPLAAAVATPTTRTTSTAWADRKDSTWIDKL